MQFSIVVSALYAGIMIENFISTIGERNGREHVCRQGFYGLESIPLPEHIFDPVFFHVFH